MKTYIHKKTWMQRDIPAFFIIIKTWKQSKCPINWWKDKQNKIYSLMENYLAITKDEPLIWATKPQNYTKWKKPDAKDYMWFHFSDKTIKSELD